MQGLRLSFYTIKKLSSLGARIRNMFLLFLTGKLHRFCNAGLSSLSKHTRYRMMKWLIWLSLLCKDKDLSSDPRAKYLFRVEKVGPYSSLASHSILNQWALGSAKTLPYNTRWITRQGGRHLKPGGRGRLTSHISQATQSDHVSKGGGTWNTCLQSHLLEGRGMTVWLWLNQPGLNGRLYASQGK